MVPDYMQGKLAGDWWGGTVTWLGADRRRPVGDRRASSPKVVLLRLRRARLLRAEEAKVGLHLLLR